MILSGMPLRAKVILSIIIGIVVVSIVSVIIWGVITWMGRTPQQAVTPDPVPQAAEVTTPTESAPLVDVAVTTPTPSVPVVTPLVEKPTEGVTQQTLTALAMPFAERIGTYSNQANFSNLQPLMDFMTPTLRQWAQDKIATAEKQPFQPLYIGTTTKATSVTVKSLDESTGKAELTVVTQRKESKGAVTNARVYNQDLTLSMVKVDGVWLVDNAVWVPVTE